jgi:hypothetical protein
MSLTFDMWTEHGRGFMGATCYVIDETLHVRDLTLGIIEIPESHTSERITATLKALLTTFVKSGVDNKKIVSFTTDSASTMKVEA